MVDFFLLFDFQISKRNELKERKCKKIVFWQRTFMQFFEPRIPVCLNRYNTWISDKSVPFRGELLFRISSRNRNPLIQFAFFASPFESKLSQNHS